MIREENILTLTEHLEHWKRILSVKVCDQDEGEKTIDALQNAIKALEQEPCEDCISRQQAIDTIDALYLDGDSCVSFRADANGDALIGKNQAITALDDLPSVTPQQKVGRWIEHFDESGKWYECDQCHTDWGGSVNYCPNCGAKM